MGDAITAGDASLRILYEQTVRALTRGRPAEARDSLNALADVVTDYQLAVLELARQLAVQSFEWPAERRSFQPTPCPTPSSDQIDLVTFHVDLPQSPSGIHEPVEFVALLADWLLAARAVAPKARAILLTDEHTAVPATLPFDVVLRSSIDRQRLMYERMRVQCEYLLARECDRASVLLDSDAIVNADPRGLFTHTGDLGLTWRDGFPTAPFNGGAIVVASGAGGPALLREALDCYAELAQHPNVVAAFETDLCAWWGDQYALALLVGYRNFAERGAAQGTYIDTRTVRFLPCSAYNFTVESSHAVAAPEPRELRDKLIVHFKGNRKSQQSEYVARLRAMLS